MQNKLLIKHTIVVVLQKCFKSKSYKLIKYITFLPQLQALSKSIFTWYLKLMR